MLSFVVLGKAQSKSINTYNLLAASAFLLLLVHPYYLFDIGFQLSYLAVLGLIAFQSQLANVFYFKTKIPEWVWGYVALSLAAQIFTFPLSMLIFHQFPLSFLISNIWIVLPVSIMMYIGLLFVLLLPFEFGLFYIGKGLDFLITFTNQSLFYIGKLPYANLQGLWISTGQMWLIYFSIAAFTWFLMSKRKRALWLCIACLFFVFAENAFQRISLAKQQKIIFYSLRKNFAMAYFMGNRYDLITDLKPSEKAGQFSVQPSLNRAGLYRRLRIKPDEVYYAADFCTNGKLMQFGVYRVYRWTAEENYKSFDSSLKVNAVLLSGNPKVKLIKLKESLQFQHLLIDATNPDYKIRNWVKEADSLHIPVHVLKKNPYFEVDLSLLPF
jgi:competence protein ComEC